MIMAHSLLAIRRHSRNIQEDDLNSLSLEAAPVSTSVDAIIESTFEPKSHYRTTWTARLAHAHGAEVVDLMRKKLAVVLKPKWAF